MATVTTRSETGRIIGSAVPLIVTSLLQNALPYVSVLAVSPLGTTELAAVSLATMTANITGFAVYQGLATSLDTLCAQAHGSGNKTMVGVHVQRMLLLICLVTVPIAAIWLNSQTLLGLMVPQRETVRLAATYLQVLCVGAPGWGMFESGKRYFQAQGLFLASLYVLLLVAPVSVFLQWWFVWHLGWGFIGAPIALSVTNYLLPGGLLVFGWIIGARQCWNSSSRAIFTDWGPMIRLAVPGLLMIEAEWLSFEIITLQASWLGEESLAAQSILTSIVAIMAQISVPWSIAAATRVGHLIGAGDPARAQTAARSSALGSLAIGLLAGMLLLIFAHPIVQLFSPTSSVARLAVRGLSIVAVLQIPDALANCMNSLLRGLGRQVFGAYVTLGCFYLIGLPISYVAAFVLHWGLYGLFVGPLVAQTLITFVEGIMMLYGQDWQRAVDDARLRARLLP
ncbi:hypothetical protein AbraIFM66950_005513 [Aspergillus brasiliensis]|nr:hypothetical protein AbraIFM66950_005513 [Aspergillus brasiliensis]